MRFRDKPGMTNINSLVPKLSLGTRNFGMLD
jgi:hypothetical protein